MHLRLAAGMAAFVSCTMAQANDRPVIGPPPAWVTPHPLPVADGKPDNAAARILLNDQQARFEADGVTAYTNLVFKIQTPQGLAAGNVNLPWNPDLDTLTVHKLAIIRAGKTIDVLASQKFTVLRRETNLERATLDGVLTASLQPEGLQVGDIVDLALSVKHHDPALGQHVEGVFGFNAEARFDGAVLATQWPTAIPVRWRARPGLPPLAERTAAGTRDVAFAPQPLSPLILPKRAPLRYGLVRQAEFSDLPDWSAAAAILAPVFAKAATLAPDGALAAEARRIAASSPDPKVRATAALALVQDQVRYLAILLSGGGLVPAAADTSWQRRYGDCKGKTVMLVGLLHALGIDAVPVLVSATGGDGLDQRLPILGLFDHVLVRATIAGRTYWLDGTRQGDADLDRIETPPFHWGLPLLPSGATLVPIMPAAPTRPYAVTSLTLDARAGIDKPAAAHATSTIRGDTATAMRMALDNLTPAQRDEGLREYWRNIYSVITPSTVSARYDRATGEETMIADGTAAMDWSGGGYETDGTGIGYTADFTREPSPDRDAPYAVAFPSYSRFTETILLPDHGRGFSLDDATFDRTIAGVAYHRAGSLKDGTVMLERTVRSVAPEFPASEAATAQATLTALGRKAVYVRPPSAPTVGATVGKGEDAFQAGRKLASAGRYAEAIEAYDRSIKADPGAFAAYLNRAESYSILGHAEKARRDLDKGWEPRAPQPEGTAYPGQLCAEPG